MPPMVFLDPTMYKAPEHEEKFDEKLAKEAARQSVDKLAETCKEKLNHQYKSDQIISLIQIPNGKFIDATISTYKSVVDEKNKELRKEGASIHLDVQESNGNFYFVAGLYGKPPADVHLESSYVLDLSMTKEAEYVKLVEGMEIDDKEHFIAVVKDAYYLAAKGQIDLAHVVIRKSEDGYCLEQGEYHSLNSEISSVAQNVSLSDAHYKQILGEVLTRAGIDDTEFMTGQFLKSDSKREQFLNSLAIVIRNKATPVMSANSVSTPDEVMDAANKGKKVEADCVTYALITQQFLKMTEKFDSAILNIGAINVHGEEIDGHMTATILVDGYLVDPAALGGIKRIWKPKVGKPIPTLDDLHDEILKTYQTAGVLLEAKKLQFSVEKEDNEINSIYHFEAVKKPAQRPPDYEAVMMKAYSENPNSYEAAIVVGDINKTRGEIDKAAESYLAAARRNPDSYLASMKAGRELYNLFSNENRAYAKEALELFENAIACAPNMGVSAYNYCLAARYVGKKEDCRNMAIKTLPLLPGDSRYVKELAHFASE